MILAPVIVVVKRQKLLITTDIPYLRMVMTACRRAFAADTVLMMPERHYSTVTLVAVAPSNVTNTTKVLYFVMTMRRRVKKIVGPTIRIVFLTMNWVTKRLHISFNLTSAILIQCELFSSWKNYSIDKLFLVPKHYRTTKKPLGISRKRSGNCSESWLVLSKIFDINSKWFGRLKRHW